MMRRRPNAFTLVETIAVMVVVSIIGGVLSTVLYAATDSYASTQTQRRSVDEISFALEKITRLVRQQPASESDPGSSSIAEASAELLLFDSGLRIELVDGSLEIELPDLGTAILLAGVDSCAFELYPDGPPDVEPLDLDAGENPGLARVIQIRIESGRHTLSTRILLRSAYGVGS